MRVMKHYYPKLYAVFSIIVSIINSMGFPLFGLIFSELLFIIMVGDRSPTFYEDGIRVTLYYLYLALGLGVFGWLQKYLFGITGENLTFDVRVKLF
jgi:ABC-type multidrug transport system fused ATPase/permease subunit